MPRLSWCAMMSQQSLPSRALRVMLELSPTAQIFQTLKCASKSLQQLGVAAAAIEQQLTPVAEWSAKIAGGDAVIHVYGYGLESNPADLGTHHSVWSATCSPDGAHIVTISRDKRLRMWRAATGRLLWAERFAAGVHTCFSPDGSCLATVSDYSVELGRRLLLLARRSPGLDCLRRRCISMGGCDG